MSLNLQNKKIQTFPGINNSPVAPSPTSAGNASHLIAQYNNLVDSLEAYFNSLSLPDGQILTQVAQAQVLLESRLDSLQSQIEALGPPPTLPLTIQQVSTADFESQIDSYEPILIDVGGGDLNFVTLNNDYAGSGQNIYLELTNKSVGKQIFFACLKNGDAYLNLSFFNNFSLSDDWPSMQYGDVLFVHGIFVPGAGSPHLIKLQSLIYVYQPS